MRRREFITLLGGATAAWPLGAHAQPERMRRIGVLMPLSANDAEGQARVAAFLQGLQELGWSVGRNVIVDSRWSTGNDDARKYAAELVALAPDVILADTSYAVASLLQVTSTVPIVFVGVVDPVGAGYVDSLARPGACAAGDSIAYCGTVPRQTQAALAKERGPSGLLAIYARRIWSCSVARSTMWSLLERSGHNPTGITASLGREIHLELYISPSEYSAHHG